MKVKIIGAILVVFFLGLCFPATVLAAPNEYGYNEKATLFHGTMANWENFVYGLPAEPYEMGQQDVLYLKRNWNKNFDQSMFYGAPWVSGSWQMAHIYMYPSDMPGWTWNYKFKMVYSPTPVIGAMPAEIAPGLFLYIVQEQEWYTDPKGKEHLVYSTFDIPAGLGKGLYK